MAKLDDTALVQAAMPLPTCASLLGIQRAKYDSSKVARGHTFGKPESAGRVVLQHSLKHQSLEP